MENGEKPGATGQDREASSEVQAEDYVFRFAIDSTRSATEDPLTDMIRTFLDGFLEIGCFTHKGRRVTVDGFRLSGRKGVHPLGSRQLVDDATAGHRVLDEP